MLLHKKLAILFESNRFKKITFVIGIIFLFITFIISLDPAPFLRFGYLGVFAFNLVGPGTLLVPVLARHMDVILLAFVSAAGMALNDSVSWVVGRSGDVVIPRSKKVERVEKSLYKYGPIAFFLWSVAPIPYDFIGLIAGYLQFSYRSLILPAFLGKFVRFLILGSSAVALLGKSGL